MKTLDLSVRHIGKTVRIERPQIAGTHDYIEGILEDFSFNTKGVYAHQNDPVRVIAVDITAKIAGLDFNLTGQEPLTVTDENGRPDPQTALAKIQAYLRESGRA